MKRGKILKKTAISLAVLVILGISLILIINQYVKNSVEDKIISVEEAAKQKDVDCILVLGAGIKKDSTPSPMLNDRLLQGVELYEQKAAPKLLMSGDHGSADYDEVNVMKEFAVEAGVPTEDIFMDHAGFSTYESMYRAKDIFEADKVIIVSQEYHLYRALYVAKQLGIEAYGVAADTKEYAGQNYRDLREIVARNKDFVTAILKPEPTYLGETMPVSGDGNITNDK